MQICVVKKPFIIWIIHNTYKNKQYNLFGALPNMLLTVLCLQKMDINGTMDKIDVNMASVILLSNTTEALLRNFSQAVQLNYQGFRDEVNYSISG